MIGEVYKVAEAYIGSAGACDRVGGARDRVDGARDMIDDAYGITADVYAMMWSMRRMR